MKCLLFIFWLVCCSGVYILRDKTSGFYIFMIVIVIVMTVSTIVYYVLELKKAIKERKEAFMKNQGCRGCSSIRNFTWRKIPACIESGRVSFYYGGSINDSHDYRHEQVIYSEIADIIRCPVGNWK